MRRHLTLPEEGVPPTLAGGPSPSSGPASASQLLRDAFRSLTHRIDAWGVALVICALALVIHDALRPQTILLAGAIGLASWLGYAVNDYFDAPFDARDESGGHKNFFVAHDVPRRVAGLLYVVVAGVVLAGFAQFGTRGILAFAVAVAAMWSYSVPPIRLKSRPGLDLASHALFVQTFPYILCLVLIDATWGPVDYVLVAANLFASLSGQLAQQVRDYEVDLATDRNFATSVGLGPARRSLQLSTATLGAVVTVGFVLNLVPWYLAPVALAFVPALVGRLRGSGARRPIVVYCCTGFALAYSAAMVVVQFTVVR